MMVDNARIIRNDLKKWQGEYLNKNLKAGWGCIALLLLILRTCLNILDHIEMEKDRE